MYTLTRSIIGFALGFFIFEIRVNPRNVSRMYLIYYDFGTRLVVLSPGGVRRRSAVDVWTDRRPPVDYRRIITRGRRT